eukprot:TRINITY_DN20726_c0_g2_i1.p1 TRINITY_DN20726_c0_g2~~TRINITY_DN20726_c0_g2_i1.p1  ORF type:complete len:398 (+),score=201.56 TRINITY_DN20726_c0_g2_i1:75-1196(+)
MNVMRAFQRAGRMAVQSRASSDKTFDSVKDYYGKVLSTSKDLKTSACTAAGRPHPVVLKAMKRVPTEIKDKFYGCGTPLPLGIEGLSILDLGSGSGRDCYLAADLVGEKGRVIGLDMTQEQIDVARRNVDEFTKTLGYKQPNLKFEHGYIEKILESGVDKESIDIIISNCVVNLSPDKPAVLQGAYDALKVGGEFYFSDVYCDRRLPQEVKDHEVLWGECVAGALYITDFEREAVKVGFHDPRILDIAEIKITDPELADICGEARFYSITYRLFKLPGMLETKCEDYGQYAVYKGSIVGHPNSYVLDDHHKLEKNKPFLVCGNTAAMLGEDGVSWLAPHFDIHGDRSVHYGLFDCAPPAATGGGDSGSPASCC